jgi:hypothetical protein
MTIRNLWTGCVGPNLSKFFPTNNWFRYYCQLASSYSFHFYGLTTQFRLLCGWVVCQWCLLASSPYPLADITLAKLAYPLEWCHFLFTSEYLLTYLSINIGINLVAVKTVSAHSFLTCFTLTKTMFHSVGLS